MSAPIERFKMETNFKGLIKLLAENLYPEPDVFVRELIQNAHDAITRRLEVDRSLAGRIEVQINETERTITFRDNGIGMDRQDIKEFLAVIGSTGTGTARMQLKDQGKAAALQLIGQFGIGLLSAFVVAERIVVRTLKLGQDEAFAWHNSGDIDCELYADDRVEVGSEVVVHIQEAYRYFLGHEKLRDIIVRYCDFIPFPIHLDGGGPENATEAPWDKVWTSEAEREAAYKQYLNRRFPDVPLDVIPILVDQPYKARGALYISDRHVPDLNTSGVMDVFVRRMFVRAQDNTLLPPWAKFVSGVIDSPDLLPTAARDNVQRNHPSFEFLQKRLGELIIERLTLLARTQPKRFAQINAWHHYHLKGMALYHDDFFSQVIELLLFETNKGRMSLRDYLTKNKPRPRRATRRQSTTSPTTTRRPSSTDSPTPRAGW
jgi:molecular chaperone HtpG